MAIMQLAKNLYTLRKCHNLTQKDIAKKLNISRQAYSNYETGKRTPDIGLLLMISQIYDVLIDQLVNQNYTADGILKERKGPYFPVMETDCDDIHYLNNDEMDVVRHYNTLSGEDKLIVDKFLFHQK